MTQSTQNTKAWGLLIGINHYPLLAPQDQLRGCINDVLVFSQVLQEKLPGINVTLLTSTDALNLAERKPTRENILNALDHLISVTNEGDIVVIYYSGHGSRYPNPHKHTGHNEAIVPCDSGDPSCDILDDELHSKMQGLTEKTSNVTLIFDSCHSESITRDPFGGMARFVPPRKRAELLPTPKTLTGAAAEGSSGWLPLNRRYVLLSGCRSDEYSYEYPVAASTSGDAPITHGAWTYSLCDALRRAGPGTTYRDLLEKAAPLVTAKFPRQHPQLEGSPDRELFGVKEIVPTPFVLVESYDQPTKTARLAAGAAVGMTIKSLWGVYPEGTRKPDQHKTGRIAVLEVTKVNVTSSEAKVIEGGNITAGTRAFEESHHPGEMRMKVFVQGPTQPQPETVTSQLKLLQQLITPADDNSGLLRQVADEVEADVKVYLLEPKKGAKEGDPLPQWTTPVINPLWVVVGKDGKILMPSHRVNHTETLEVYDNLERVARFRQGLRIENNDPDNALQGKIKFHITKLDSSSGTWTKVESPEQQVGTIQIQEGERVGGAIINHHHETVYVAVLEFGESGGVNVLYPAKGVSEPLAPGQTARFADEFGPIRIAQRFKDMCTSLPSVDTFTQPEATLKVFATLQPMDFRLLEQDHYKAVQKGDEATPNTLLGNLLALAFAGRGNREFTRLASTVKEPWVTVQKSFVLHATASPQTTSTSFGI